MESSKERPKLKYSFKVKLKCGNCGHEWEIAYKEYDQVEELFWGVEIYNHKTKELITIECPICKLRDSVYVVKRSPFP